jgi:hypothetical protein
MAAYLDPGNFLSAGAEEARALANALDKILTEDMQADPFRMIGNFQRILSDNAQRPLWDETAAKLDALFKCGRYAQLDGPMIGVSMGIRDSDYFRETARLFGKDHSTIANLEWMATAWNATFASTGIWMGKTFEPVTKEIFGAKCGYAPKAMGAFDPATARIGRNFFREPANPNFLQGIGLPVLTQVWRLRDRPADIQVQGFFGTLLQRNLEKEKVIPYTRTGGIFLAGPGASVVEEMRGKRVYQLNYRWPLLEPAFPMTRLVDELAQIAEGIYLGQLVMATRHYSIGQLRFSLFGGSGAPLELGDAFGEATDEAAYGYQNNGYFLMIDPAFAKDAYSDRAFPMLRPRSGESGYRELGCDQAAAPAVQRTSQRDSAFPAVSDWKDGWQADSSLRAKFTTFCLDEAGTGEPLRDGESILQMLQRVQKEISAATLLDDHLRRFETLHRLFRSGVPPTVVDGVFQGKGSPGRFDAPEARDWYGQPEPCTGFTYYHGATLNLHFGFADTFYADAERRLRESAVFPSALAVMLQNGSKGPDVLNVLWATIGRFVFPWAGKSFERISGRKLSMLLDESPDLEHRYPARVAELREHPASWPHYDLVLKDQAHDPNGLFESHLRSGAWDQGMNEADKDFWRQEAATRWVFGSNLQDARILSSDPVFRALDMNYHAPLPSIQAMANAGPSLFVRQGYTFLGSSDRASILPVNQGKRVFQFNYRYPMIGGAVPIGLCLDELVEIAEGLFLGQLIYATEPFKAFHSSMDPAEYQYQLFGYFLLLDNTWERHRQAIGFDVDTFS